MPLPVVGVFAGGALGALCLGDVLTAPSPSPMMVTMMMAIRNRGPLGSHFD
jgi:hypothetical protein